MGVQREVVGSKAVKRYSVMDLGQDSPVFCPQVPCCGESGAKSKAHCS